MFYESKATIQKTKNLMMIFCSSATMENYIESIPSAPNIVKMCADFWL